MEEITIIKKKNGYVYSIDGSTKVDGEYICKNTEEFEMGERIMEAILGYRVKIERR